MVSFKGFHWKLGLYFLATLSIILLPLATFAVGIESWPMPLLAAVWILLMLTAFVFLMGSAYAHGKQARKSYAQNDREGLRRGMKRMKLASIPFFLLNFLFFFAVGAFPILVPFGFLMIPPVWMIVAVVSVMTYLIMLGTSVYGFAYMMLLKKSGSMTLLAFVVNMVLHGIFVWDMVSAMYVLGKYKESRGEPKGQGQSALEEGSR